MKKLQLKNPFSGFSRLNYVFLALFIALLTASVVYYLYDYHKYIYRIVLFPDYRTHNIVGEKHVMPRQTGLTENITSYIEETVLGPLSHNNIRLLPASTGLKAVSVSNSNLYVDFTEQLLLSNGAPLGSIDAIEVLEKGIRQNFPQVKDMFFTVEGLRLN